MSAGVEDQPPVKNPDVLPLNTVPWTHVLCRGWLVFIWQCSEQWTLALLHVHGIEHTSYDAEIRSFSLQVS